MATVAAAVVAAAVFINIGPLQLHQHHHQHQHHHVELSTTQHNTAQRSTAQHSTQPCADTTLSPLRSFPLLLINHLPQVFPGAKFYHVTEEYAALLADLGYYINGVGSETTLQVGFNGFDLRCVGWRRAKKWHAVLGKRGQEVVTRDLVGCASVSSYAAASLSV